MKITALEPQKKRKNRWNLHLDGRFYCGLDEGAVIKLGMKVGQEVDENFLQNLEGEEEHAKAWNSLLFFLKSRDRSEREIVNKLKQKGYTENVIKSTVEKATGLNLIDDQKFAEMWVRERAKLNPKGKRALSVELMAKGVDKDLVEKVFAETFTEDVAELSLQKSYEKAIKKYGEVSPDNKQKIAKFLLSRGFDWGDVKQKIRIDLDENLD